MKPVIKKAILFSALICFTGAGLIAQTNSENKAETVMDQWYSLVDRESDERIGARHVNIVKKGDQYVVSESVSIEDNNSSISYDSEVNYQMEPKIRPTRARAMTYINGEPYMSGVIEITDDAMLMTSAMIGEEGKFIEPVVTDEYELKDGSVILFGQGLEFISEKLLEDRDKIEDVVMVMFPAEIDAIAELETGCRMVRKKEGPNSTIEMYSPEDKERSFCKLNMNGKGEVRESTFFDAKMVKASKEEALKTLNDEQ